MEAITTGITNVMTIVTSMLDAILGNPVLTVLFSAGFVAIGLRTLKKLIRTAK